MMVVARIDSPFPTASIAFFMLSSCFLHAVFMLSSCCLHAVFIALFICFSNIADTLWGFPSRRHYSLLQQCMMVHLYHE